MLLLFRAKAGPLHLAILFTVFVALKVKFTSGIHKTKSNSSPQSNSVFKITNVKCDMEDKDFGHFEYCRLKAIRRNVAAFSFKLILHETAKDCLVNVEWLRRYNGYKPFLVNQTFDACKLMKERKLNGYFRIFYNLFAHSTNFNHSCPYDGAIIMDNYFPEHKYLLLPVPTGDYLVKSLWTINNKHRVAVDVWYTFEDPHDLGK